MEKILFIIALFLSAFLAGTADAKVVVTIKPLHSLVAGVMGETGTPELLVTGNISPHDFQLKPSQMRAVQSADIVFYIDTSFETFLNRAFATLPAGVRKVAVTQKKGLAVFPLRRGGVWETHKHQTHIHETEEGHDNSNIDMHVWLDPQNAQKIVKFIAKELSAVYPKNKDIYRANAAALIDRLKALDGKLKQDLAGLQDKPFIVFHDAYQYFEKRYDLNGVGSITFEPDESPSTRRIKKIIEKTSQTKCVFREPYLSDKLVNTVIEGSNTKIGILDPEATSLDQGKDLYFIMMENLASSFKECLSS
jgi:zinc transport system substrate-binding protein